MTTADFIRRSYRLSSTKERKCSSVLTDEDGNVYSYGYHYPLLFNIDGLDFVNTAGYSNTTAKHINWAKQATNYTAIHVELPSRGSWAGKITYTLGDMLAILNGQCDELIKIMNNKTRRNTQVYAGLERDLAKVQDNITTVKQAMGL